MRNYTTLGQGKSTKVLSVADYIPARTVTTCESTNATAIARALRVTDRETPAALYDLAVFLDGTPVEARRHLLGVYDAVAAGQSRPERTDQWETAEALVEHLALAVAGQPAPVIVAVRDELASHLDGFDGVLVPARATTFGYKREHLDLVISGVLSYFDGWWDYLVGPHVYLSTNDDDDVFPTGGRIVVTGGETYELLMELYYAEPLAGADYASSAIADMVADDDDLPDLLVRADHLLAYAEHHRPALVEALRIKLT